MSRQATEPSDCALAIAIPLTRAEWLRELAQGRTREYARFVVQSYRLPHLSGEQLWDSYRQLEAEPVERAIAQIAGFGTEVIRGCRLSTITEATRGKQVVIIVAHWRSGLLYADHVNDWDAFLARLESGDGPMLSAIRDRLPNAYRDTALAASGSGEDRERLLDDINDLLGAERLSVAPAANEAPWPRAFILDENRRALNAECGDILDTTSGLELSDATHTADAVAAAVDRDFTGDIDLTVCFSVVLGERIKRAVPGCRIITNREMTAPLVRLPFIRETLRLLRRRPGSYIQTARSIRAALATAR